MQAKTMCILLIIGGLVIISYGASRILSPTFSDPIDISEAKKLSQRPETVESKFTDNSGSAPLSSYYARFLTNQVFSVGNPINFSIQAYPRNPANINGIVFLVVEPHQDFSWLNHTNVDNFLDQAYNPLWLNYDQETNSFIITGEMYYPIEGDIGLLGLVFTKDGNLGKFDNKERVLTVYSAGDKLQFETNRLTLEQIEQTARSNLVIEGLSWIVAGWIPVEAGIHFWPKRNKGA